MKEDLVLALVMCVATVVAVGINAHDRSDLAAAQLELAALHAHSCPVREVN